MVHLKPMIVELWGGVRWVRLFRESKHDVGDSI